MTRRKNPVISSIVSFIGIDYNLLQKSGEENITKFYLSGFFVAVIVLMSFFSVFYAFDLMFHRWYAEILLAVFFSLTFLVIYLLLIQTFSKETLPVHYKTSFFTTSNVTRICFVFLISFLIAQPIKIFLLEDVLDIEIEGYKTALFNNYVKKTEHLYQKDLAGLRSQKLWYEKLDPSGEELKRTTDKISEITRTIESDKNDAFIKISISDFFLQRVALAGKHAQSWMTTLIVITIFSIPVYLIYSISDNNKYYIEKRNHDHDLVLHKYQDFKKRYAALFKNGYDLDIDFCELYEDPPFNKIKKPAPTYLKTADLTEKIIHHGL